MVVLPTADPPDGPTRAENNARLRRVGARLRRLVTAPVGDAFRMSVVRAVMRGLALLQGQTRTHVIADTVEGGVMRLLEVKTEQTPGRARILIDLRAMHAALGADARYLEPARALSGSG
jgi:hypothetical protein